MRYLDEYRDPEAAERFVKLIRKKVTRPWTIMEVCGGQTHSIARFGLQELLPESLTLLHGPGCPVCVTPLNQIDKAIQLAARPEVIFCSFGDMLRVPGTESDLMTVKAEGGDVRVVTSPLEVLEVAKNNPDREVVFFAIGFETTAPANAMAVYRAKAEGIQNVSFLVSQVIVPPAMQGILSSSLNRVQGFLAAGHVCTVMGIREYEPIAETYKVPIVATGFEPLDILQGIHMCVCQLEDGRAEVENQYARSVLPEGNFAARNIMQEVFEIVTRDWRGIGGIPDSGLGLREAYHDLDAERRFRFRPLKAEPDNPCQSGLVLQGIIKPTECEAFGDACTPESPLGATMVSSEGACAAYFRYRSAAS